MNDNAIKLMEDNLKAMYDHTDKWIEDVVFYQEELVFFNSLISDRINNTTTEDLNHKEVYRNIEALLYKLSEDVIKQIKLHKKELATLIDTHNLTDNHEESKLHFQLLEKMDRIKHGIKKLKKALFSFMKDHPFEFDLDSLINDI
ncbi:hypothetical protein [Xanthomarina sp.]|uniref:hypothetical protein n=1 Tax=Xanthomarina sp. TaxID=1931211 RepID=UPI002B803B6F|nr:hypothetical protein [Xanthomarina sp.]HLV39834.1 hypothetical protein [Xanthomarina sp.]